MIHSWINTVVLRINSVDSWNHDVVLRNHTVDLRTDEEALYFRQ